MQKLKFSINGTKYEATVAEKEHNVAEVELNGKKYVVEVERAESVAMPHLPTPKHTPAAQATVTPAAPKAAASANSITAPLPGSITAVNVKAGETVEVPFEFGDLDYAYLYTLTGRYHVSEDYMADEITFGPIKLIGDAPIETYHLDLGFVVDGCVGSPDTGYEVEGNTLKGVVRITNDGNHDYDKSIAYKLYRQEGSGRVEVENYFRPLELKVGDATEVPFEFDGLDHTYAYTLAASYYVSEDKVSEEITFGPIHLKEVETFSLDVDFRIENCKGDETAGYEVTDNKIKGVMVVTNQSGRDYADEFSCTLIDGTERVPFTTSIEVKAGETIEVPFEFDNLVYEREYILHVGYCYEEGSMADVFIFGPFTLIDPATGIEGIEASGEEEAGQPVYDLRGVRMPDGASLPKGIYIRGGKKFVVK